MAQEPTTLDQIKAAEEIEKAKTALRKAQLEALEAQQKLDAAATLKSADLSSLETDKKIADAEKDLATAQSSAQIAKEIGDVKSTTYSGAVDLKDKTGTVEARLLAAKAVRVAADKIALAAPRSGSIVIVPARTFDSFGALEAYEFRRKLVEQSLDSVLSRFPPVAGSSLALASAGMDAFGKILSFFKTDYLTQGLEFTLDESIVVAAVAGAVKCRIKDAKVYAPTAYLQRQRREARENLITDLQTLVSKRQQAEALLKERIATISRQTALAGSEKDEKLKEGHLAEAAAAQADAEKIRAAIDAYESFINTLTVPPPEGQKWQIANLIEDRAINDLSTKEGALLLLVRLEVTGGGYLLKKNLLTGLGGMPLYHMGGSAVSYVYLDGASSEVLGAGTSIIHGGFVKSGKVAETLEGAECPTGGASDAYASHR